MSLWNSIRNVLIVPVFLHHQKLASLWQYESHKYGGSKITAGGFLGDDDFCPILFLRQS